MSLLIPSAVVRHRTCKLPETLVRSRPFRPNRSGNGKGDVFLSFCRGRGLGREISRIACSGRSDDSVSEKILKTEQWKIFKEWDVPWDWKITLFVMMPYLLSIALAGIVGSTEVSQPYHDSLQPHLQNTSEVATRLFVDQLLKTAVKLLVLYMFVGPYQPFPDDVFSYNRILTFASMNLSASRASLHVCLDLVDTFPLEPCRFFGALVATYWCLRHKASCAFICGCKFCCFYSGTPISWEIYRDFHFWNNTRAGICSNSQPTCSNCYACMLEPWCYRLAYLPSIARV